MEVLKWYGRSGYVEANASTAGHPARGDGIQGRSRG